MSRPSRPDDGLERRLALLLKVGTWAACALIAAGILLPRFSIGIHGVHVSLVVVGVVLLIALPVMRVALMAWWFTAHRELQFALVAAVVLIVIVLSAILGAEIA
jgi:hypothetical protein